MLQNNGISWNSKTIWGFDLYFLVSYLECIYCFFIPFVAKLVKLSGRSLFLHLQLPRRQPGAPCQQWTQDVEQTTCNSSKAVFKRKSVSVEAVVLFLVFLVANNHSSFMFADISLKKFTACETLNSTLYRSCVKEHLIQPPLASLPLSLSQIRVGPSKKGERLSKELNFHWLVCLDIFYIAMTLFKFFFPRCRGFCFCLLSVCTKCKCGLSCFGRNGIEMSSVVPNPTSRMKYVVIGVVF